MPPDRYGLLPLAGRRALVTGGTAGVGLGAARRLAVRGAAVAVAGRDAARGAAAVRTLEEQGATAAYLEADVTDATSAVSLGERAAEALGGRVDLLVNAAGGGATDVPLERVTPQHLREVLALNLESVVLVTRGVMPQLLDGGGSVVSVGGIQAMRGMRGAPVYAAAKAGVEAFTRCLVADYGARGVVATCVHPGAVRTARLSAWIELRRARGEDVADIDRRALEPEEVGEWIAFLAGPFGAALSGRALDLERP